jgi:hypothetical protein
MAAGMKMRAFWDVTPCSLVGVDRRFRGAYCLHHQGDESSSPTRLHGATSQKALTFMIVMIYSNNNWYNQTSSTHGEMKNAYTVLVGKPEGNNSEDWGISWMIILKLILWKWDGKAWISDTFWAVVNTVMKLWVSWKSANFLTEQQQPISQLGFCPVELLVAYYRVNFICIVVSKRLSGYCLLLRCHQWRCLGHMEL